MTTRQPQGGSGDVDIDVDVDVPGDDAPVADGGAGDQPTLTTDPGAQLEDSPVDPTSS